MKTKIALLFFVCCTAFAAQQKPESKISKFFKNVMICGVGFEPVKNENYVQRAQQAQRELQISEKKLAKIYDLSSDSYLYNHSAITSPFGIHLNQKYFDTISYGQQRHTLLHEAAHVKNNDPLVCGLKATAAGIFFGTILIGSPVAAYNMIEAIELNSRKKTEHRADLQAAQALQCISCLQDKMKYPYSSNSIAKGYMSNAEFQPILNGYLRDKKMCEYHEKLVPKEEEKA